MLTAAKRRTLLINSATGLLVVAFACTQAPPQSNDATGSGSPLPTPKPEVVVVERTLDLEEPKRNGQVLVRLPYGEDRERLGGLPACDEDCSHPCPCSVPLPPRAYAVDARGRFWFNDVAKGRIAVFDQAGKFQFEFDPPGDDYDNRDIQAVGNEILITRPTGDYFPRLIRIRGRNLVGISSYRVDGERYHGGELIFTSPPGERLFTFLTERKGSESCCLGYAEISIAKDGSITAERVPGLAYRGDGWLIEGRADDTQTIVYRAEHAEPWAVDIEFRMLQEWRGEKKSVDAMVSWEPALDADGTVHLLIIAGTTRSNRPAESGYWYLTISPDGEVGNPVPLAAPNPRNDDLPNPGYQKRHLALDSTGRPIVMWAGPRAAAIRTLPR